jgi:hypothetical protein
MSNLAHPPYTGWTVEDSNAALREGWDIFSATSDAGPFQIQRVDETEIFADDQGAWEHFVHLLHLHSPLHLRALRFLREHNPQEITAIEQHTGTNLS